MIPEFEKRNLLVPVAGLGTIIDMALAHAQYQDEYARDRVMGVIKALLGCMAYENNIPEQDVYDLIITPIDDWETLKTILKDV